MSSIPASVIATATQKLSQAAAWLQYPKDRAAAEQLFEAYAAQGYSGYFIHDAGQKESCSVCLAHDGQYFEFTAESRRDHLPPFHLHCECSINLEKQEKSVPYDLETGLIGEGATNELIVNSSTQRVNREFDVEMWFIKKMLEDSRTGDHGTRLFAYGISVGPNMLFDLKNRAGSIWSPPPKKRAYIFRDQLIRYDLPGNMLAGYGAAYVGILSQDVLYWAAVDGGGTDDPLDAEYITKGWHMFYQEFYDDSLR